MLTFKKRVSYCIVNAYKNIEIKWMNLQKKVFL